MSNIAIQITNIYLAIAFGAAFAGILSAFLKPMKIYFNPAAESTTN